MNKLFTIYWDLDKPARMAGKILDITRYHENDIVVNFFRGTSQLRIKPDDGTCYFSVRLSNHWDLELNYER